MTSRPTPQVIETTLTIRIAPALNIGEDEIREGLGLLGESFAAMGAG